MTNAEAIEHLKNIIIFSYQDGYTSEAREALDMAFSALQEQEAKAQLSAEGTTPNVKKTCTLCKHYPPESKWPCIDCDMRNPADRWEPQELSQNSTRKMETCNQLAKDICAPCKDTISRQAALDEIDGFLAVDKYYHSYSQGKTIPVEEMRERLKQLPSAQPEVVRCKDCKYCDRGIDEDGNPFLKCLGWVYGGTQEEDFCSHAERRTDER